MRYAYNYQRGRSLRRKTKLVLMMGGKCSTCGYAKNFAALVLHHTDPTIKGFEINMRSLSSHSWDKILEEAGKCILLCQNCHSEAHHPECAVIDLDEKDGKHSEIPLGPAHFCCDCGKLLIHKQAIRCLACHHRCREKIDWPPTSELLEMVAHNSFSAVAKELGVSDNAIRHRIKHHPPTHQDA